MSFTAECVSRVFLKCFEILRNREPRYGDCWKTESLDFLYTNIFKKVNGLRHMVDNGKGSDEKAVCEELIDIINYAAMAHWRVTHADE